MRGVISAGMVWALEDLGYTQAFDAVYGSSAGAINAAYFLAGQAGLGTTIYFEDINNRSFIDLSRALLGRPIVNLGFLLDDVARHRKPLADSRSSARPTPLSVLATDVDTRSSVAFRDFRRRQRLFGALRAGATMPVVAGGPFEYGGRRLLDASLREPIPLPTAEAHGHTHVLVLLTRSGAMNDRALRLRPVLRRPALAPHLTGPGDRVTSPASGPYSAIVQAIDAGPRAVRACVQCWESASTAFACPSSSADATSSPTAARRGTTPSWRPSGCRSPPAVPDVSRPVRRLSADRLIPSASPGRVARERSVACRTWPAP